MASAPPDIPGLTEWRPLARGGFATVWQARQETLNRLVAVKIDQRTLETDTERRRFLREAGAAGRMSGHPGIVTVHDAGLLGDDRPFLVMELCSGGSLTAWLKPENRPEQRRVVEVGARIADALAAAHNRGVLHRDVKPANILIDAYDHAGLADFGLAAIPEPDAGPADAMDAVTPAYAAPEVLAGEPATEAGDVYALAATLYALLNGRPPNGSNGIPTPEELVARRERPVPPIPGVEPALMAALLAGLAGDPDQRPTAAGFRDLLLAAGRERRRSGRAVNGWGRARRDGEGDAAGSRTESAADGRRRRAAVLVAALACLILLTAGTFAVIRLRSPQQALEPTAAAVPPTSSPVLSERHTVVPEPPPPEGFADCSAALGVAALCRTKPECWAGLFSYMDSPIQATPQTCAKKHVYQTYAAVQLAYSPRRQPQLEADKHVRAVCNRTVLNKLLIGAKAGGGWETFVIPPQFTTDTVYRCIFGHGEKVDPFGLRVPR